MNINDKNSKGVDVPRGNTQYDRMTSWSKMLSLNNFVAVNNASFYG